MVMYSSFGSRLIDQIKLIAQKLANKGHGPTSEEEEVVVWWWWVVMMFPRGVGMRYQMISSEIRLVEKEKEEEEEEKEAAVVVMVVVVCWWVVLMFP